MVTWKNLVEVDVIKSHRGPVTFVIGSLLALVAALLWCWNPFKWGEGFYPTPDQYGRMTGAGTGLDFDVIRPEGFAPVAYNKCTVNSANGPVASNACQRRSGAPISANSTTRIITDTPSGCDCTCACPSVPGDVLGVVKSMSPNQLNQPIGSATAADDAVKSARKAASSAAEAVAAVGEAETSGTASSMAKKYAALAANYASNAMTASNKAQVAASNGKVMDAEKAASQAASAASAASKAKDSTNNSLNGVSEMSVLSNIMSGTPFGPSDVRAANDNVDTGKGAVMMNGNKVVPYDSKKGMTPGVSVQ